MIDVEALFGRGGAKLLADLVREPTQRGRSDLLTMIATDIRRAIAGPRFLAAVRGGTCGLAALEQILAALPGDLREQCLDQAVGSAAAPDLLRELAVDAAGLASAYIGSRWQQQVVGWRRELQVHRVRLVLNGARQWIERAGSDVATVRAAAPHLRALAADAGVLGKDLLLALRARVPEAAEA